MTIHITWALIFMIIGGIVVGKYLLQFFMALWILLRWDK